MHKVNITEEEASYFITNSNAIEQIHHTQEAVKQVWKTGKSSNPEIKGHVKAMRHTIKKWPLDEKITMTKIEQLHKILMKRLLPKEHLGIRTVAVELVGRYLGQHYVIKQFPLPQRVRPLLDQWCSKVNAFKNPTKDDIWQSHLAFEHIHPFADGNGRSGRLIWLWLRYKHGFGYDCVENATKGEEYYPQFKTFSWLDWV